MEYKIGEEFIINDIKYKCIEGKNCTGCFFNIESFTEYSLCSEIKCCEEDRKDRKSVKFIKV